MRETIKVLLVEDTIEDAELLIREMHKGGLQIAAQRVDASEAFQNALTQFAPDIILSDYSLPGFGGMNALEIAHRNCPDTPFIFVSGTIGEERAIEALKQGATDYVLKDKRARLVPSILRALKEGDEHRIRLQAERRLQESEKRFRLFMDYLPGAAYMRDLDGRFTYVNKEAETIARRNSDDILGKTIEQFYPSLSTGPSKNSDEWMSTEDVRESIIEVGLQDGIHFFLSRKFPIRDYDGHPVMMGGIAQDITDRICAENAQKISEERFRSVADATQEWIWEADRNLTCTYSNSAIENMLGYPRDELIGTRLTDYLLDEEVESARQLFRNIALDMKNRRNVVLRCRHKQGGMRWMESTMLPLLDAGGELIGYRGANRDVTERIQQQEKIARLSRIHALLSGINSCIVRVSDREELFRDFCRIAGEYGGFTMAWIGLAVPGEFTALPQARMNFSKGVPVEAGATDELSTHAIVERALRTREPVIVNDAKSDAVAELGPSAAHRSAVALPLLIDHKGIGVIVLHAAETDFFDFEELKLLKQLADDIAFALDHFDKKERLNYLAYYDSLTGLPNRTLFLDRLGQLIAQDHATPGQIAVVLIDLERFGNINDTLGRPAGDTLLSDVAKRLRATIPDPGYLARINADCFGFVVQENRTEKDGGNPAEWKFADSLAALERKIAASFNEPAHLPDKDIRISVRSGIALFPTDGLEVDALLRNAEAALKNAKKSKAPYRFYTAEMNARAAEKLSIENRLRKAFDEDQFVLDYQPKIDLVSGRMVGLEALIRWYEPGVGLIMPANFIPVLEETGLIIDVGSWVIARVHAQYQAWLSKGLAPPRIAVNVSELQIRQKDFVQQVKAMLATVGDDELEFEITESLFMEDIDENIAKLRALRDFGITVGIDDFGTGYSSLSYIGRLPIDTLKIDRSFIIDITTSKDHMAIVSTIISLAHLLKLKVIAEGVETDEQTDLLSMLGCDQIQGYVHSMALSPDQIEPMLPFRKNTAESRFSM